MHAPATGVPVSSSRRVELPPSRGWRGVSWPLNSERNDGGWEAMRELRRCYRAASSDVCGHGFNLVCLVQICPCASENGGSTAHSRGNDGPSRRRGRSAAPTQLLHHAFTPLPLLPLLPPLKFPLPISNSWQGH